MLFTPSAPTTIRARIAAQRHIERLLGGGQHGRPSGRFHQNFMDLVDVDGGAEEGSQLGKSTEDAVPDAAPARLVAGEPLLVEKDDAQASPGQGHGGQRARGPAPHHDDVSHPRTSS
jgi:hypothetical protein